MRWLCWGELLLISLVTPEASFLGHLAGILAGLACIAQPYVLRRAGARWRRLKRRVSSAAAWLRGLNAAPPVAPRPAGGRRAAPPAPGARAADADAVLTAEELRALHVARFSTTQRPRGASPPPQRAHRYR